MSPAYRGTAVAWRIDPGTRRELAVKLPWLLVPPVPLGLAALASHDPGAAAVLLGGAALSLCGAFGFVDRPIVPEPLPAGPEGHKLAAGLVRNSPDGLEREHVALATTEDGRPVLVHRSYYPMHSICVGPTGTSKTQGAVLPQLEQNLEMGDVSVVYTMFKEDPAAVARIARKARELGMETRLFTTVSGRATRLFNPLLDPAALSSPPEDLAEMFLAAKGMLKSEAHGHGHWAAQNERFYRKLFTNLRLPSFRHYVAALGDKAMRKRAGITAREVELALHVVALMERLGARPILNATPADPIPRSLLEHAMTTDGAIRRPTLSIFLMPTLVSPTTPVVVARLFLYLMVARLHQWQGPRVRSVIMAYDDCAPMIEQSLKQIFANARELNLGLLLGTQNISDFKNDDVDMMPSVLNNTALKVFLGVKDRDGADYVRRASGETTRRLKSDGRSSTEGPAGTGSTTSEQEREVIVQRITPEDIARVNASDELAIVEALPPRGYTNLRHPTIVTLPRSITAAEYAAFAATPWPEPDGVRTARAGDLALAPIAAAERPPAPPAAEAPGGVGKKAKRADPAEVERAREIRDRLRRFGNDTP